MSPKTRLGDEERRLMHLVPAPAVRLMKRRVLSRPGVNSLMVLIFHTPGLSSLSRAREQRKSLEPRGSGGGEVVLAFPFNTLVSLFRRARAKVGEEMKRETLDGTLRRQEPFHRECFYVTGTRLSYLLFTFPLSSSCPLFTGNQHISFFLS